jgi:hypothetical protein
MRAYLIGIHPGIWEVICNGFEPPIDPKNPTLDENKNYSSQWPSHNYVA